ncbi:MAG: iron-containing alcohol dehydrogenase [Chloroflexota bacterium]|nr:MAG: iron-containing alcohol dehydrogenase [Chloroflexota bacterium]
MGSPGTRTRIRGRRTTRPEVVAPFTLGRLPRIRFGAGRLAELPEVVAENGSRLLIVTGGGTVRRLPHWPRLLAGLDERGLTWAQASVSGEPTPDEVDEIVAIQRPAGIEVVVGIGGGSALDTAKAVAGLLPGGRSVRDHLEGVGPGLPFSGPTLPFIAVPTTAGTGSEATRNAVLTERGPHGFKRSFRDERLVAVEAVVDPDLLIGAPPALIAANGLDALTQLLESYVSLRAGRATDALALDGLAAVRDALPAWHAAASARDRALEASTGSSGPRAAPEPVGPEEGSAEARAAMAYGALLSGICLANAGLGAAHGLASPLGAHLPIPHGAACGAVLEAVVEANIAALTARSPEASALDRYARLGRILAGVPEAAADDEARAALARWVSDLCRRLAIPGLGTFGLDRADIPTIVAESRGSSMRTNPVDLSDAEVAGILERSL